MFRTMPTTLIAGAIALGFTAPVVAETSDTATMRAEINALKAEMAQMRSQQSQDWLSQRQAEEVKSLIRDVLADAETRASLLQDGVYAGHDGKFFLASADGKFRMNVGGQLQFRWIGQFQDDESAPAGDSDDTGFQVRRTKIGFEGFVTYGDRKWEYEIVLAADREAGGVEIEDFVIGTEVFDGWDLSVGKFKIPFLRQELVSSKRQLAADRASVTEFFTLDRSEQIQLAGEIGEMIRVAVSLNDGADEEFSTIGGDPVELAVAGRLDAKLAGDWKQMRDTTAWRGEEFGAFIGGAAFYQLGDGEQTSTSYVINQSNGAVVQRTSDLGSSASDADYLGWTIDGQIETNGFGLMAAVMGGHIYDDDDTVDDRDMYGILVEGGYMVTDQLQPFARWEWIDDGVDANEEVQIVTVGMNYYFKKHDAKFTLDVPIVYAGDRPSSNPFGNSPFSDGLGFAGFDGAEDDIMALVRAQFQLLF